MPKTHEKGWSSSLLNLTGIWGVFFVSFSSYASVSWLLALQQVPFDWTEDSPKQASPPQRSLCCVTLDKSLSLGQLTFSSLQGIRILPWKSVLEIN